MAGMSKEYGTGGRVPYVILFYQTYMAIFFYCCVIGSLWLSLSFYPLGIHPLPCLPLSLSNDHPHISISYPKVNLVNMGHLVKM